MNKAVKYLNYLFTILIFSGVNTVAAYTMPTGIPETSLDFTQEKPTRPSDWSSEIPGYYYIDMQNGSTKVTYGSETTPRKYFPSPIPAGSYIEIKGDLKQGSGYYKLIANGTDEKWVANTSGPVWITQAESYGGAFIESRLILTGANIFVTDFQFSDGGRPQIGSPSNGYDVKNVVVRNSDISVNNVAGTGISIDHAENVILYNNKIHDLGDINTTYDQDSHLMKIGSYTSNVWILDNEGYNASGSGLQVNGNATTTHNIYVGNNEIYNVRQSGLWVKKAKDVVFSNNYVHDIISTPWSVSKGMGAQYEPNGFWMINNHIEGAEYGIRIASTTNTDYIQKIYMIGNVIHDIEPIQTPESIGGSNSWQSSAIHIAGGDEIYIYNNLIYDAPNGVDSSSGNALTKIKNNMIFDLTKSQEAGIYGRSVWVEFLNAKDDGLEIANNYFDDHMFIQEAGSKYYELSSLEKMGGVNNILGSQFLSNTDLDSIMNQKSISGFDLSPIKDKGANVEDILTTRHNTTFPGTSSISIDILNELRKQGASIDIGPFELGGEIFVNPVENNTTIPQKPGNISVLTK